MQTRAFNDSALKTAGSSPTASPTSSRSQAAHNNTMNNATKESAPTLARQSKTRREFDQGRSTIGDIKLAPLPLQKSNVPLNAAPHIGAGTENRAALEELEDEYEPQTKKAKEDLEEVEDDLEEVERLINEAKKELSAAQKECRRETANPTAITLLEHMEKTGTDEINPTDPEAPPMQQLTNSTLTESDIIKASWRLQNRGTNGDLGFYKRGTETTKNKRGKTVNKSEHLVGLERWEYLKEKDIGLPSYLKERSHNMLKRVPEYADRFPDFLGCGADYFQIAEEPESWKKEKSLTELVAQLFGYPSWRQMHDQACATVSELGGMTSVRFIGDDIVPWPSAMPQGCKKAGYIFTFNVENTTRFDVEGQLSDLPAKNKPTRDEFLRNHDFDIFSVEKLDDNGARDETFGTKRFRRYKDLRAEIGQKFFPKNGGKGTRLKVSHMPSVVGEKKRFEMHQGTFEVTRLI